MELTANEAAQGLSNNSARVGCLGQTAGEQVNIVDVLIDAPQGSNSCTIHYIA